MDDEVIFIRANTTPKREAAKDYVHLPKKLASYSDILAPGAFAGLVLENTSGSNQVGAMRRHHSSSKTLIGKDGAYRQAAHTPAKPDTAMEAVECQEQFPVRERTGMQTQITKLKGALKNNNRTLGNCRTLGKQILLKAQIESQDEAYRKEIRTLQGQNAKLEQDKGILEGSLVVQKDKMSALEAKIIELTEDARKQKKLYKTTKAEPGKLLESIDDARTSMKQSSDSKKKPKKRKLHHEKWLEGITKEELDADYQSPLSSGKSAKDHQLDGIKKNDKIEELQDQILKLKQEFDERGDQIIQLGRDPVHRRKLKQEKQAAREAQNLLRKHVTAMLVHYGSVLEKNTALLGKLTAMAEVEVFEHRGSLFRQELVRLKGRLLVELNEYKNRA